MTDPVEFNFRPVAAADAPALARTAAEVFEADWTEAFVQWKYFGNPAGPAYGECVAVAGKPVAFFSNLPAVFKLGSRPDVRGAQAVDAMVAAPVRRHGLFLKLAQEAYRRMDQDGLALTYVFASAAAQAGFVNRLGYVLVGRVPRYVCVLDPAGLAAQSGRQGSAAAAYRLLLRALAPRQRSRAARGDGLTVGAVEAVDERFDTLWTAAAEQMAVAVVRDRAYLRWRYTQNPLRRYQILAAERGQALAGCAVLSVDSATRTGRVLELFTRPDEAAAGPALLVALTDRARAAGCVQMQAWMLPQHTAYVRMLKEAGFRHWPARAAPGFLRYSTALIVRVRPQSRFEPDPTHLQNWYLTMGDHDYY